MLIFMADLARAEHQNAVWLYQSEIAESVELHQDTVKAALATLTEAGHLARQVRRGRQTIYTVQPVPTEGSNAPHSKAPERQSEGSDTPHSDDIVRESKGSNAPPSKGSNTPAVRGQMPLKWGVDDPSYITINNHQEPPIEPPTPRARTRRDEALPDWMPMPEWRGYLEHRQKQKAPLIGRAHMLAIATLTKLRDAGHDPAAVLDQSTANGWKGLFALKETHRATPHFATTAAAGGPPPSPIFAAAAGLARYQRQWGGRGDDR